MARKDQGRERFGEPAAGNGIMSRRIFLESTLVAGAAGTIVSTAKAEPLTVPAWSKAPGTPKPPVSSQQPRAGALAWTWMISLN